MTEPTVTHIHTFAEAGERQHTQTVSCWCHPHTLRFDHDRTVVDHNGATRPGIRVPPVDADYCSHGHDWATNARVSADGSRRCALCARLQGQRYEAQKASRG